MKTCVTTYSFQRYIMDKKCDYIEVCNKTKEMGFDGIEFIDLDNKDFAITTEPLECAKEIRAHCEKIGLEIVSYTIGANLLCEDGAAEVARVCRAVDVAEALGAKVMRHDVCWALPKKHLYSYRDAIKTMAPMIREISEYARTKGIRTCTENHGYIFQSPERVEELILAVGCDNYGWLCDCGNFLCADADPVRAVAIAAPYAFHVHVKDFLFKSGANACPPGFFQTAGGNYLRGTIVGHGVVPVRNCITALKRAGYDGYVSVEFEGKEECLEAIKSGLDFLKTVIA